MILLTENPYENYYQNKINELERKIYEIQNTPNNINQSQKILELEDEIKKLKSYILSPGERLISINFISEDRNVNFSTVAKISDKFSKIEDILLNNYPIYKETDNYFFLNDKKINRNKTIRENEIKDNDLLILKVINN